VSRAPERRRIQDFGKTSRRFDSDPEYVLPVPLAKMLQIAGNQKVCPKEDCGGEHGLVFCGQIRRSVFQNREPGKPRDSHLLQ